jgi:hypothetical protein
VTEPIPLEECLIYVVVASCMRTFPPFLLMFSINTKCAKTRENLRSHHKHDHHRSSDKLTKQPCRRCLRLSAEATNNSPSTTKSTSSCRQHHHAVIFTRRHEVLTQSKSALPRSCHSQFVGDRTLPPQQISPRAHRVDYINHPRKF